MGCDIENMFKSEAHIRIVSFFHENPTSVDTPRGIATWTGYKKDIVKKVLDELVRAGVLVAHPVSSTTGYSYTHDEKIIKIVKKRLKELQGKGGLK